MLGDLQGLAAKKHRGKEFKYIAPESAQHNDGQRIRKDRRETTLKVFPLGLLQLL
jgi:hypothetical protein